MHLCIFWGIFVLRAVFKGETFWGWLYVTFAASNVFFCFWKLIFKFAVTIWAHRISSCRHERRSFTPFHFSPGLSRSGCATGCRFYWGCAASHSCLAGLKWFMKTHIKLWEVHVEWLKKYFYPFLGLTALFHDPRLSVQYCASCFL